MTDKIEVIQAEDGKEYVIRKGGYFYRPKAEGYTSNVNEAGRFSFEQAIFHSFPNGPDGPRDGITYEPAPRTADAQPVAWMTHHDEPMLFLSREEADKFCDDDEEPISLYAHPAQPVAVQGLVDALEWFLTGDIDVSGQALIYEGHWEDIAAKISKARKALTTYQEQCDAE